MSGKRADTHKGAGRRGLISGNKLEVILEVQESEKEAEEDGVPGAKKVPAKRAAMKQGGRNASSKKMRKGEGHDPDSDNEEPKSFAKEPVGGGRPGQRQRRTQVTSEGTKRLTGINSKKSKHLQPENESEDDDTQKAKKTSVKRGRVSSISGAEAKGKAARREQGKKQANGGPKWQTAKAPHPCQECRQRSDLCMIYVGKTRGRRRVVCVGCRTRKGGCSLNYERQKLRYVKVEEDDEDEEAEDEGYHEKKTELKLKARETIPTASQRPPRAVAMKLEQADDSEWCLGELICRPQFFISDSQDEAGPSGGEVRRWTTSPDDTTDVWARFRRVESCVSTFQREVRGGFSEIRQELGRMKSDQEVNTQVILQKMLEMGSGTQEQLKSVRQQTTDISHAMGKVVDQVERMHIWAGSIRGTEPVYTPGLQEGAADDVRPRFTERTPEDGMVGMGRDIRMKGVERSPEANPDTIAKTVLNSPAAHGSTMIDLVSDMMAPEGNTPPAIGGSTTDPARDEKNSAGSDDTMVPEWNAPDGNGSRHIPVPIEVVRTPPPVVNVIESTPKASIPPLKPPISFICSPGSLPGCQRGDVAPVIETEIECQDATTHLTPLIRPSRTRPPSPGQEQGLVTRSRSSSRAPIPSVRPGPSRKA